MTPEELATELDRLGAIERRNMEVRLTHVLAVRAYAKAAALVREHLCAKEKPNGE